MSMEMQMDLNDQTYFQNRNVNHPIFYRIIDGSDSPIYRERYCVSSS